MGAVDPIWAGPICPTPNCPGPGPVLLPPCDPNLAHPSCSRIPVLTHVWLHLIIMAECKLPMGVMGQSPWRQCPLHSVPLAVGVGWMCQGAQAVGLGPMAVVTLAASAERPTMAGATGKLRLVPPQPHCMPRGSRTGCTCHGPGCLLCLSQDIPRQARIPGQARSSPQTIVFLLLI